MGKVYLYICWLPYINRCYIYNPLFFSVVTLIIKVLNAKCFQQGDLYN